MEATIASSNYATLSTDVQATADDEFRSVGDTLGDIDPNIDKVVDLETVRPLIAALPEREKTVLLLRFFESMTQTQIAERMGYSQMHVSRLLAQALRRLREQVRDPGVNAAPAGGRRASTISVTPATASHLKRGA